MIPNLSLSASGGNAGPAESGSGDNFFGDVSLGAAWAGKPSNAISGGTGISINTPINFGESQENESKFRKLNEQALSDPTGTNNQVILFGILAVSGLVMALLLSRK